MITAPIVKRTMITGDAAAATVNQSVRMPSPAATSTWYPSRRSGDVEYMPGLHEEGSHLFLAHREARASRARPDRRGELGE